MAKHSFEKHVVCPYCDTERRDDPPDTRDDQFYLDCENCQKKFVVEVYRALEYSTEGDCASNGDLPHNLVCTMKDPIPDRKHYACTKCHRDFYGWQLADGQYPKLNIEDYRIQEMTWPNTGAHDVVF